MLYPTGSAHQACLPPEVRHRLIAIWHFLTQVVYHPSVMFPLIKATQVSLLPIIPFAASIRQMLPPTDFCWTTELDQIHFYEALIFPQPPHHPLAPPPGDIGTPCLVPPRPRHRPPILTQYPLTYFLLHLHLRRSLSTPTMVSHRSYLQALFLKSLDLPQLLCLVSSRLFLARRSSWIRMLTYRRWEFAARIVTLLFWGKTVLHCLSIAYDSYAALFLTICSFSPYHQPFRHEGTYCRCSWGKCCATRRQFCLQITELQ